MRAFSSYLVEYTYGPPIRNRKTHRVFSIMHKGTTHRVHATHPDEAHDKVAKKVGFKDRHELHKSNAEHFKKVNAHLFKEDSNVPWDDSKGKAKSLKDTHGTYEYHMAQAAHHAGMGMHKMAKYHRQKAEELGESSLSESPKILVAIFKHPQHPAQSVFVYQKSEGGFNYDVEYVENKNGQLKKIKSYNTTDRFEKIHQTFGKEGYKDVRESKTFAGFVLQ